MTRVRPSRPRSTARAAAAAVPLGALLLAGGCATDAAPAASGGSGSGQDAISVTATDDACDVSRTDVATGISTFAITNEGSQVTEVYVYDGDRIVTEKENIGPGTSYELTVDLDQGDYEIACKPGMVGDGIRQPLTVAAAAATETADPLAARAGEDYRTFVQEQAEAAVPLVTQLAEAVKAGDAERARSLYAASRVPWERIEPVAESFGDLDPRMDAREADLAPGDEFTGWHRLEKALWTGEDLAPLAPVADQLVADVTELRDRVPNAVITPTSIGNGSKALLDEVATGKITGEEEAFSHTDLSDFEANVAGARKGLDVLRPLVEKSDPDLVAELDARFADVQQALEPYRTEDGWVSYDTVDQAQRRELSRVVDALSEPLSGLAAAAAG